MLRASSMTQCKPKRRLQLAPVYGNTVEQYSKQKFDAKTSFLAPKQPAHTASNVRTIIIIKR